MNILIIKFRNIGDVLLITPLLHNLKRFYPQAMIDVAINQGTEAMLSQNPNVDNLIIYQREKIRALPKFKQLIQESKFFLGFRQKPYDLVINLTEGDRGTYIAKLTRSDKRVGYHSKNKMLNNVFTHYLPKQEFRHTLEANLDPLRLLNIPIESKKVEVFCTQKDHDFVEQKLFGIEQFVHVHPVSRWLFKCISDQTMAKIIDYCELELKLKVVITAAPVATEIEKVKRILSFCQSNPLNLSGQLSLQQTVSLNLRARCFIGVDTAIMHMSAANDTPVLAFFGPSGADHWGPWDNDRMESSYTNRNGPQIMGKHRVFSESRDCQPCGEDGCNGSKISDCLMFPSIETVKSIIVEILNNEKN